MHMHAASNSGPGLTTTLDIAALVSALVWPLLLIIAVLLFRDRLVEAARVLAPRVKALSIGVVSLEFAEARPLSLQMAGAVDLRHAGQSQNVNDSTLRSFFAQISDSSRLDYAVVDLGEGREWLTSRLFILSVILARMRGLRAFVFLETAGHIRRRFVGVAECEHVRWRLAMRFPGFEAALAHAESKVWPKLLPLMAVNAGPIIADDQGRLEWVGGNPEPAAQLLRYFLDEIQLPAGGVQPSDELEALPSSNPPILEHARWLGPVDLEQIMGSALIQPSVRLAELTLGSESAKATVLVLHTGRWLAVTREEGVFDRLIDRLNVVEAVAQKCVQSLAS